MCGERPFGTFMLLGGGGFGGLGLLFGPCTWSSSRRWPADWEKVVVIVIVVVAALVFARFCLGLCQLWTLPSEDVLGFSSLLVRIKRYWL